MVMLAIQIQQEAAAFMLLLVAHRRRGEWLPGKLQSILCAEDLLT